MSSSWRDYLSSDADGRMRISKHGGMLTDALLIADAEHLAVHTDDRSPEQLCNTAAMPGIVGEAWAMADWHFGYGFPIGGVVATDVEAGELGGAISPGGVGFDINCGVRLCSMDIELKDIDSKALAGMLSKQIPAGASSKGGVGLNDTKMDSILGSGAAGAIDMGWGESRDLEVIESHGVLESEERRVGERAVKRGMKALGTLGSGNHFLELQVVDRVVDPIAASAYGLREGQITAMIHTGSRGLGHQVCSEHEGEAYLDAMRAAGNYAFANRSALTQRLRGVLREHLGPDGDLEVVYDVSHNIAKVEDHVVHGKTCKCCVHRKGATRALGGDHPELASRFSSVGQPVLVPGDMGTASWVLAGPTKGGNDAFASSCHGAGRQLSRTAARKSVDTNELMNRLEQQGVHVRAKTPNVLSEEAPEAYKDVDDVVRLTNRAGLARPVARLRPLAVIKG